MASTWAAKYWRSFFGMKQPGDHIKTGFRGAQTLTKNVTRGWVLLGMGVGIITASQHLVHSPGVNLSKKKRLTFPELDLSGEVMESAGKKYGICRKLGQLNFNVVGEHSDASFPNPYQRNGKLEIEPHEPKLLQPLTHN